MAAARARERTNVDLSVHVHPCGTQTPVSQEIVRVREREGVDLSRVILSPLCVRSDIKYYEDLLRTGVNISYDHILAHIAPLGGTIRMSGQGVETIFVGNPKRVLTGCETGS